MCGWAQITWAQLTPKDTLEREKEGSTLRVGVGRQAAVRREGATMAEENIMVMGEQPVGG
jgi:hypothetical protein